MSDVNEFHPTFSGTPYSTVALNTAPIGTSLLQVSATDADAVDNAVSYSIINRIENGLNFSVDPDGVIRNDGSLPEAPVRQDGNNCVLVLHVIQFSVECHLHSGCY